MNYPLPDKVIIKKKYVPITLIERGDQIIAKFKFNRTLIDEIKSMESARWNPENTYWTIKNSERNRFQLAYLAGQNPYKWWDRPLGDFKPKRKLYEHQMEMFLHCMTYHYIILAAEMGCLHPETQLRDAISGETRPIRDWAISNQFPILKSYDREGNIVTSQPSRFVKKTMRMIQFILANGNQVTVGENHVFLSGKDLCFAKNLKTGDSIQIERSSGISITSRKSTQSKKPIGLATGTVTEVHTSKINLQKRNSPLLITESCLSSPLIYNTQVHSIQQRFHSLASKSLDFLQSHFDYIQKLILDCIDTLTVDYLTLMAQCQNSWSMANGEIFLQRILTLPVVYSQSLDNTSEQSSFQATKHGNYPSMVAEESNNWEIISTLEPHDTWIEKSVYSGEPSIPQQCGHYSPASYRNLQECEIVAIHEAGYGDVYDLTIPEFANYFDANGISHQNTGKTLVAIEVMESSGFSDWLYIGPKSALASVNLELYKWNSSVRPTMYTYDGLKRLIETWPKGKPAPRGVIFDESSRLKTPTAQRSIAARHLANNIRSEYGHTGFVILMSGSPAPKSPADWYNQCETTYPGFIKEGTYEKFKNRLGLIVTEQSITGGSYPKLVTWRDDEKKCQICGDYAEAPQHDEMAVVMSSDPTYGHNFQPSKNEVSYLYQRMKGLVVVKFKKDCIDLPDKQYRIIHCKPSGETLRAAKIIQARSSTTIQALTLLRELSDGFQYIEEEVGSETCPTCQGNCTVERPVPIDDYAIGDNVDSADQFTLETVACPDCEGTGQKTKYNRATREVPCPKEQALLDILDAHEDDGRLVVYGGFTGSIDRITSTVLKAGWETIRVDGRGWTGSQGQKSPEAYLADFQDRRNELPKLCFIGQPGAAGMGLTLTASCEIVFFSNTFKFEDRLQSEDRIHRIGMDTNRGALITDLVHLPSDELVLENLRNKRRLQDLSLGNFRDEISKIMQSESERVT